MEIAETLVATHGGIKSASEALSLTLWKWTLWQLQVITNPHLMSGHVSNRLTVISSLAGPRYFLHLYHRTEVLTFIY